MRQEFAAVFTARVVGGELAVSTESTDVRFVDPTALDALPVHDSVGLRIRHFLEHCDRPYLG